MSTPEMVFEVEKLLLMGKTEDIITEGLKAEGYTASEIGEACAAVLERWMKECGTDDPIYARQLRSLRNLYDRSYKLNDFKTCLQIQKQIETLQAKHVHISPSKVRKNAVSARINRESLRAIMQQELAALLKRDVKTLQRWHEDGLPHTGEGKALRYDWYQVQEWMERRRSPEQQSADSDKDRKDRAEADIAEMKRDQLAGTLVDALEIKATYSDFLARLRTNIRGLPDRLVPRLEEGATLTERLGIAKGLVDELLRDVVAQEEAHD